MTNALDVFAYLRRIGHNGPRAPTFATLRTIHALHPAAIPFENLDPLLGRPVLLDLPSLQAKLVQQRRGGYCFEQNTLCAAALETLGFQITTLAARVVWRSEDSPRTHMLISVNLDDGPYIADVGFGGYLFAEPLKIEPGLEQQTHCGVFRILRSRDEFTVQTWLSTVWRDVYRFTLERHIPADYEVANGFTATHPKSHFTSNLLAERVTPESRFSISNMRVTERRANKHVVKRVLRNEQELLDALETGLGIDTPGDPHEIWGASRRMIEEPDLALFRGMAWPIMASPAPTLPTWSTRRLSLQPAGGTVTMSQSQHIFVVDDEAAGRDMIGDYLKSSKT